MASEVQYINCQELHNPTFTPLVVPTQTDVSSSSNNQQLEATIVPIIESAALPVISSATPTEALPDSVPLLENTREFESKALQAVSPVTLTALTEVLQVSDSPLNTLRAQSVVSPSGGQDGDSLPVVEAEHKTPATESVSTPKPDGLPTSDQDDDVQFILSVTRKKRKNRHRHDHLSSDQGQGAIAPVSKNTPGEISNHVGKITVLGSQTGNMLRTAVAVPQKPPHPLPAMQNAHDNPSFPLATPVPMVHIGASSAVSPTKSRKSTIRKRKRDPDNEVTVKTQILDKRNTNSVLVPVDKPVLHQHLQYPQTFFSSRPLSHARHMPGTNPANTSQPGSGLGVTCTPLSTDTQAQPTGGIFVQRHMYPGAGPTASAIQAESLRRRPSLYAVPLWQSSPSGTGVTMQAISANTTKYAYQSPYICRNGNLTPMFQELSRPGNQQPFGSKPPCSIPPQHTNWHPLKPQESTAPPTGLLPPQCEPSKQQNPPNMLVDIAQTCQDNFPFALIAKRHNQPIQKVFDIFSAVIQIPLLRSAVDARRPGKLGSLRMKEFRGMKKGLKESHKGERKGRKGVKKVEDDGVSAA